MITKSMRTKQALARALEKLLKTTPLSKVTVKAIAKEAQVDRQTFYYHFETLSDLVEFACLEQFSCMKPNLSQCKTSHDLFSELMIHIDSQKDNLAALLSGVGRNAMRDVLFSDTHELLFNFVVATVEQNNIKISKKEIHATTFYCQHASAIIIIDWIRGSYGDRISAQGLADFLSLSFERQIKGLFLDCDQRTGSF